MSTASHLIATFFYVGHLKPAPGTWGSLAALPIGWALFTLGGLPLFSAGIVLACALGWWATALETKGKADHDPSEIVIDEVAGQWIALLPVMLDHVAAGRLSLQRLVDLASAGPARIYNIAGKGRIAAGFDADFAIVDLAAKWTITDAWIASRSAWTPYDGMEVAARPVHTVVRGGVAVRDGELAASGLGQAVRFLETLPRG